MLTPNWSGVVVTDMKMAREDGLSLLQRTRQIDPELPVILITGHGDVSMAVHAMCLLFQHFVTKLREKYANDAPTITVDVIRQLMSYDWPGNVRELQNTAERFVLGQVHPRKMMSLVEPDTAVIKPAGLTDQVEAFEKCVIANELERHKGNIKATFESLNLPRKTLYNKMQRYKLNRHDHL